DYFQYRDDGSRLRLGAGLALESFPADKDQSRARFDLRPEYRFRLGETPRWQMDLQGQLTHQRDRDRWVYNRVRAGAQLRLRHDAMHLSRARLRIGHRDQNE